MQDPKEQVSVQSDAYVIAKAKAIANNARNVVRTTTLVGYPELDYPNLRATAPAVNLRLATAENHSPAALS